MNISDFTWNKITKTLVSCASDLRFEVGVKYQYITIQGKRTSGYFTLSHFDVDRNAFIYIPYFAKSVVGKLGIKVVIFND